MNDAKNAKHIVAVVAVDSDQFTKDARMSHIKKEKSRDAARSRRGRENCQFYALATLLPIPEETSSQLDKASIIRLTMSYLQLREFFSSSSITRSLPSSTKLMQDENCQLTNTQLSTTLQSLDGFLLIMNPEGRCLYVSNAVSEDLGLAQVDLIGSSIFNFVHSSDHEELYDHLKSKCCDKSKSKFCQSIAIDADVNKCCCSFFIRMKSTQPRRTLGLKSSGYKVVHLTGHVVNKELASCDLENSSSDEEANKEVDTRIGFAGVGRVLSHTPLVFGCNEPVFVVKIDRSLRITYCDEQITKHAEYSVEEVKDCTIYQFIHTCDLIKIRTCHVEILEKGHIVTPFYRWLLKNGTFIWVQSRCALVQEKHQFNDEECYVWITYVIAHDKDDIPINLSVEPKKATTVINEISENVTKDTKSPKSLSSETQSQPGDAVDVAKLMKVPLSPPLLNEPPALVKPDKTTYCKLIKQTPDRTSNLKRLHSLESTCKPELTDEVPLKSQKQELTEDSESILPSSVSSNRNAVEKAQGQSEDVLDVHSTMWCNPPNREAVNHSDLYTTVIHHHYPYGIDPNLLNSNPIFAKMLTANYVTYESLFQREAFILPSPAVNIFAPVLSAMPQLIPAQPAKLNYCPTSVASIIDELRRDPMREVNPPNKVILSRSHMPSGESSRSPGAASHGSTSPRSVVTVPNPTPIFTFPSVSSLLRPLGNLKAHGSSAPIFFHPVNLTRKVNALNSLPI